MITDEVRIPEEFADVCPFSDSEFHEKMVQLVKEPMFKGVVNYALPGVDYDLFVEKLLSLKGKDDFQVQVMKPFLEQLVKSTTDGLTISGEDNYEKGKSYTFISNHRDIVLDASFLNLNLIGVDRPTTEVAIGNNLLIYDWISILVRLNKSFIVKRDLISHQRLEGAMQLSNYVHFALKEKKHSVWIAQREGRAKDSDDRTQESLLKMLGMGGEGKTFFSRIKELNLMPLSISYEYDPNDYLKAKEFLMKKRDSSFKKSQEDDLLSMSTGIMGYKGRVHFEIMPCVSLKLDKMSPDMDKTELLNFVRTEIDKSIYKGYRIYPCNYIAYDMVHETNGFLGNGYNEDEKAKFIAYVEGQLSKVEVETTDDEKDFMRNMIYTMYSNPLKNKLSLM